jgi:superfamily II DNA/RNA helicase
MHWSTDLNSNPRFIRAVHPTDKVTTSTTGQDVIGIAATGSGKTLAFGLPALAHTRAQLAAGVADGKPPHCETLSAAVEAP